MLPAVPRCCPAAVAVNGSVSVFELAWACRCSALHVSAYMPRVVCASVQHGVHIACCHSLLLRGFSLVGRALGFFASPLLRLICSHCIALVSCIWVVGSASRLRCQCRGRIWYMVLSLSCIVVLVPLVSFLALHSPLLALGLHLVCTACSGCQCPGCHFLGRLSLRGRSACLWRTLTFFSGARRLTFLWSCGSFKEKKTKKNIQNIPNLSKIF